MRISLLSVLALTLSVAAKDRILVQDFVVGTGARKLVDADVSRYLSQRVRDVAVAGLDTARFEVLAREVAKPAKGKGKGKGSSCDEECLHAKAIESGANFVLTGDVQKVGSKLVLSLHVLDVAAGTQLAGQELEAEDPDALAEGIRSLARKTIDEIPGAKPVPAPPPPAPVVKDTVPAAEKPVAVSFVLPAGPAEVIVDGATRCTEDTLCKVELPRGNHDVRFRREGFFDTAFSFVVPQGDDRYRVVQREPAGRLVVNTVDGAGKPVTAQLFLDGKLLGNTPTTIPLAISAKHLLVRTAEQEVELEERPEKDGATATATVLLRGKPQATPGMVVIPAGCFRMGSRDSEGDDDEHPRHKVCLSAFALDTVPVTNAAYAAGGRKAHYGGGRCHHWDGKTWARDEVPAVFREAEHPVTCVDWSEAAAFCKEQGKRLPTEAEYEYANLVGTASRWNCGSDSACLESVAWTVANSELQTHPVGTKDVSVWGLHDMTGNVWAWTADWYAGDYYAASPVRDPQGPKEGERRVLRGGAWSSDANTLRAAMRASEAPNALYSHIGFRCAR